MIHHRHDGILVPPARVAYTLNLTTHDDNLAGRNKLATAVSRAKMLGNTSRCDITTQSLSKTGDHLGALTRRQHCRRAGCEHKVAIEINNQSIAWCSEKRPAFGGDTKNVRARLLDELLCVASVNDWDIETTPFVDTDAVSNSLGGQGKHGWVVTDEDDSPSRGNGSFENSDNVGNGKTAEEWPHGKVLEASGR